MIIACVQHIQIFLYIIITLNFLMIPDKEYYFSSFYIFKQKPSFQFFLFRISFKLSTIHSLQQRDKSDVQLASYATLIISLSLALNTPRFVGKRDHIATRKLRGHSEASAKVYSPRIAKQISWSSSVFWDEGQLNK